MILTGNAIRTAVESGDIKIEPFNESQINPNSYNYRLSSDIIKISGRNKAEHLSIEPGGSIVLDPNSIYLGSTQERIGSSVFTPSLIGRSSVGRLGLFVQVDADHGQVGAAHCWTLELRATRRIRLTHAMMIGQVSFWLTEGNIYNKYNDGYTEYSSPEPSKHAYLLE